MNREHAFRFGIVTTVPGMHMRRDASAIGQCAVRVAELWLQTAWSGLPTPFDYIMATMTCSEKEAGPPVLGRKRRFPEGVELSVTLAVDARRLSFADQADLEDSLGTAIVEMLSAVAGVYGLPSPPDWSAMSSAGDSD